MNNKLGEVLYEKLKKSRSYANGTPGVQEALDAIYREQMGVGRRQPGWVPQPANTTSEIATRELDRRQRNKDYFAQTPGAAGQVYEALSGGERPETDERGKITTPSHRPEQVLLRAIDPVGTAATHTAKKKGVSPKRAEAIGTVAGIASAGVAGAGKALAKKGAGKLASGAALNMSRGARSLPAESIDDLLRAFERTGGSDEGFDLSKLVDEPAGTPVHKIGLEGAPPSRQPGMLKPTFDEPITTEELDKLEAAIAEKAQRLETAAGTTKRVTAKMRERLAGQTPSGSLIEGILDQPIGVQAHGAEDELAIGGAYTPGWSGKHPSLLLDPREANIEGTTTHELGHHIVRKAGEKAPARQLSLEAERDAVASIHAKKGQMHEQELAETYNKSASSLDQAGKDYDSNKISYDEYMAQWENHQKTVEQYNKTSEEVRDKYGRDLLQTNYRQPSGKNIDEVMDFRVKQDMRKLRGAEEDLVSGGPELRSADDLLQTLQEGQLRQPYRPPEHPTYKQFEKQASGRRDLLSIQHGWDEGMADLIESYTQRPDELNANVRALLDEKLRGRVK